jgi:hypothetical protein
MFKENLPMRLPIHRTDGLLRRFAAGAFGLAVSAAAGAASQATCEVTCLGKGDCSLKVDGKVKTIRESEYVRLQNCDLLEVTAGALQVRYWHKGKPVSPVLGPGERMQPVLAKTPPDACWVSSDACLQERMKQKNIAPGGHGIDSAKSNPAGSGQPCERGLPCGMILPASADWKFPVGDAGFQGRMELVQMRGTSSSGSAGITFPVQNGEVQGDGRQLQPSAVYGYKLVRSDGQVVATGEFTVLGSSSFNTLKRLAQDNSAKKGLTAEAAWLDALSANELDWDLNRLVTEK